MVWPAQRWTAALARLRPQLPTLGIMMHAKAALACIILLTYIKQAGCSSMAAVGYPPDDMLFEEMAKQNPWWAGGAVPSEWLGEFKRPGHAELLRRIGDHPVHAILGARQVGKTTLLYQLAAHLVAGGEPRRVMVARLGELGMFPSADNLRRMLDLYSLRVLGEPLHSLSQRTYVLLDEAQAAKNWQQVVRRVVDWRGPMTFIASGSSSAGVFGNAESLIGRVRHQAMEPMGFSEYLRFKNAPHAASLERPAAAMRNALAGSARGRNARMLAECVEDAMVELAPARRDLAVHLDEYMLYGGYPGIAEAAGGVRKMEELKARVRLSMYSDIVKVGSIRNPEVVERLFWMLAQGSPRLVNKEKMIQILGINRRTLDAYLYLLKAAYLASYASRYAPSSPARARSEKKAYVNDAGVRNAVLSMPADRVLASATGAGMMAETVACSHTRRLWLSLEPDTMAETPHYWRSGRGDEVDLVIELHGRAVPIEVEYGQSAEASGLEGLSRFAARFGSKVAIVVTRDRGGLVDERTVAVPLWLYLAMCG